MMAARFIRRMRRDIAVALERDPAARTKVEAALAYSGLHAIWAHRITHSLWRSGARFQARLLAQAARFFTGVEIHPGAIIGEGCFIDHGMGVVIGETAVLGEDVTLYHGVTLGGTSLSRGKRHPTIGDRVTIGAGAKILGDILVGEDSRIGANAVVVKTVPPNSVIVGVPGQVVHRLKSHHAGDAADLDHSALPDVLGQTLRSLLERVETLESALPSGSVAAEPRGIRMTEAGEWIEEDFSI